jgi:hypothetical protein
MVQTFASAIGRSAKALTLASGLKSRRSLSGKDDCMDKGYLFLVLTVLMCGVMSAQLKTENTTLMVNGKSGTGMIVQFNSRTYVDLESLVRIAHGSLTIQENKITLILPGTETITPAVTHESVQRARQAGLTQTFMIAGIETVAAMREWASTMANAIRHGYEVTDIWAADYRAKAADSLREAGVSAATDADRSALQLLTNEFQSVDSWSNGLVVAKKNMDIGKYATSRDALRNEPLSQKIINCGHFLGTMLGSAEFKDDPSCH